MVTSLYHRIYQELHGFSVISGWYEDMKEFSRDLLLISSMNLSHAFLGGFTDEVFRRCIILGIKRSQVVKSLYQGGLPGISWFIVQDPQI